MAHVPVSAAGGRPDFSRVPTYPWVPDQGDGAYRNPILCADYSDPDVIRHGDDFYLVASSFNCTPGLPVLHSTDLVNWTIVNYALDNLPGPGYERVRHGCGVWAPAIRFHAGKFYLFFPMVDEGIYVVTADDPAGRWSEPHLVQAGAGLIDPCPLWDEDGKAYLVYAYARSRSGIKHKLRVCPMAPDASRLLDEGVIVFDDPERQPTLEGPKFHKKDGWYYILAPAGGVGTGWQLVLRSRHVYGPYEEKVVLEQGSTPVNGPHQGALVDLPGGEWWFVHFQELLPYGRIVHLQPVAWKDGWPLMGVDWDGNGVGEPVACLAKPAVARPGTVTVPATSDAFDSPTLGLQWQWHANHERGWHSLTDRLGWLRLFARPLPEGGLADAPHLLLQKFPARAFAVRTRLTLGAAHAGEQAGLIVMGLEHAAVALRKTGGGTALVSIVNGREAVLREQAGDEVELRVEVRDGGLCRFSAVGEGGTPEVEGPTFQAREGQWIGAKVGLFAASAPGAAGAGGPGPGSADFEFFRFEAPRPGWTRIGSRGSVD